MNRTKYLKVAASLRKGAPIETALGSINGLLSNALSHARKVEAFRATGLRACAWCKCAEAETGSLFCSDACDKAEYRSAA